MPTSVAVDSCIDVYGFSGKLTQIPCTRHLITVDEGFFPALVCFPDGEMVCVLRGGAGHIGRSGRLDVVRSTDGGFTWSDPVIVADSDADDRNPALGIAADGALVLLYAECRAYDAEGNYMPTGVGWRVVGTRSTDHGHTWEPPTELPPVPGYRLVSPYGGGDILTLPSGRLLASVGVAMITESGEANAALVAASDDNGCNWAFPSPALMGATEEVDFELLADGRLLAIARAGGVEGNNSLWTLHSADGGATWSEPVQATFDGLHPGQALLLPGGEVLLTFGCRRYPFGVRAVISHDNGRTWDWGQQIVLADNCTGGVQGCDCGYPTTVLQPDGHLFTAYYRTVAEQPYFAGTGDRWIAAGVRYRLDDLLVRAKG